MNRDLETFYALVQGTREGVLDWMESLPPGTLTEIRPDFAFGSLAGIYSHIADTYLSWVGVAGLGSEDREASAATIDELRKIFADVDATVYSALASFEDLDEPFEWAAPWGAVLPLTRRWLILHPITHEFHHKGQALALARVLGRPHPGRPDTDLVLPSGPIDAFSH